jgi:DNA polymerase-3 subunit delta
MADLKPAYLIHGDDHGAVAERRARLHALTGTLPGGASAVEVLEGDAATPAGVAAALAAMTLAVGRRVIIVEGAERWREADVAEQLAPALASMPPDTTLALFAREEARAKAPAALHDAVKRAGGQVVAQLTVKPWELPAWVREQATRLGLSLDSAAAKALVALVGERQQRLLRELEKLALEAGEAGDPADPPAVAPAGAPRRVSAEHIEQRAAHSSERRAFALADALVAAQPREALLCYLQLREQGERITGLMYVMASRVREALALAQRMHAGESRAELKRGLRMPSRAADRLLADVERSDPAKLRAALQRLAELELDTRGGAPLTGARSDSASFAEDTAAQRAIEAICA